MIDIHCHILPGLDDGAQDVEEAAAMAEAAVNEGIHTIIATPHHANQKFSNEAQHISQAVKDLKAVLDARNIPLDIVVGQEARIYPKLADDAHEGIIMPLNASKYVLIEFPSHCVPEYFIELIHELNVAGLIPVIAHPERNREIFRSPERLYELVQAGALSQLTSHSVNGLFGRKIQTLCRTLCAHNLVHFIASDAHHIQWRPFHLRDAYQHIDRELGPEFTRYYQHNAECVLQNSSLQLWKPNFPVTGWRSLFRRKKAVVR